MTVETGTGSWDLLCGSPCSTQPIQSLQLYQPSSFYQRGSNNQMSWVTHTCTYFRCESVCEKNSEIIWNVWKDVLFNALKVSENGGCLWRAKKSKIRLKIWTLTSLIISQIIWNFAVHSQFHHRVYSYRPGQPTGWRPWSWESAGRHLPGLSCMVMRW